MAKSFAPLVATAALFLATTSAASLPNGSWPASKGTVQYKQAYIVKAGEVFDGKMKTYERSDVSCQEQTESGADTSVFKVEAGGHLKNVIIGKNQMEGVHCDKHDCIIENVWWDDVCEDALSVKGGTASSVTKVIGGGARYADDKVIQHNGFGTVDIDGFYGEDISKLYRSCGTCGNRPKTVNVKNVYVVNPTNAIVTVNKNWGDKATLKNVWVKSSKASVKVCQWSQGNANGEPKMLGNGPSPPLCQYSTSDIHINQDISKAAGQNPSQEEQNPSQEEQQTPSQEEQKPPSEGSDSVEQSYSTPTPTTKPLKKTKAPKTTAPTKTKTPEPVEESAEQVDQSVEQTEQNTTTSGSVPNGSWPASKGTVKFSQAYIVKAGEVFDGKMKTYERSDVSCQEQTESGADTSVFKVEAGGHLKNVIIGKNQMEGVHCDKHDCIIENVWWDDVCEDALSVKGGTASSVTKVIGGGARYADDKVIQHNGFGTVDIDGFYGEDISKLYRSCGTCGNRPKTVNVKNVYVVNPTNAIVTVNKNWGDKATLKNVWVKSSKASVKVCQWSQGNANGEPKMLGNGPSPPLCQYSASDIHINQK
ncbi:hypothetical protein DVH05_016553 [Phytophthora capsici]|nr:hypothetical protein DVH05_016553 [Phytophthora capsici]